MFKRLFIFNDLEYTSTKSIIFWWEKRRFVYNILLIVFGILSLFLLSIIVRDLASFFSTPIFFFFWVVVFMLLANFFYTLGWVTQLIVRNSSNKLITRIRSKFFIYGLIISFFVTLTPCILAATYTFTTGERIESPYADITTAEPNFSDVVGAYRVQIDNWDTSKYRYKVLSKTTLSLNSDSTFSLLNYPSCTWDITKDDCQIVHVQGNWSIANDYGKWVISLTFLKTRIGESSFIDDVPSHYYNMFNLKNNQPPYEIYVMIGDPDSWNGFTFEKID